MVLVLHFKRLDQDVSERKKLLYMHVRHTSSRITGTSPKRLQTQNIKYF